MIMRRKELLNNLKELFMNRTYQPINGIYSIRVIEPTIILTKSELKNLASFRFEPRTGENNEQRREK